MVGRKKTAPIVSRGGASAFSFYAQRAGFGPPGALGRALKLAKGSGRRVESNGDLHAHAFQSSAATAQNRQRRPKSEETEFNPPLLCSAPLPLERTLFAGREMESEDGAWLFAKRGYRFLFVESRGTREEGRVIFDEFLCQFESEKGDIFFFLSFILLLSTPAEERSRRWRNHSFRFAPLNAYSLFLRSFLLFAFIREDNNVIEGGRNESSGRD